MTVVASLIPFATLVAIAEAATQSCHADLLVRGIEYVSLTPAMQTEVGRAVAQTVAEEAGLAGEDVLDKIFPGNYNAKWSPSAGRPEADVFLATLVNKCGSAEMILGVFRGPQLQAKIIATLNAHLANTGAVRQKIEIIGASVVPETAATDGTISNAGQPANPELVPGSPNISSAGSPGWMYVVMGLMVLGVMSCATPILFNRWKTRGLDEEDQRYRFTGH